MPTLPENMKTNVGSISIGLRETVQGSENVCRLNFIWWIKCDSWLNNRLGMYFPFAHAHSRGAEEGLHDKSQLRRANTLTFLAKSLHRPRYASAARTCVEGPFVYSFKFTHKKHLMSSDLAPTCVDERLTRGVGA